MGQLALQCQGNICSEDVLGFSCSQDCSACVHNDPRNNLAQDGNDDLTLGADNEAYVIRHAEGASADDGPAQEDAVKDLGEASETTENVGKAIGSSSSSTSQYRETREPETKTLGMAFDEYSRRAKLGLEDGPGKANPLSGGSPGAGGLTLESAAFGMSERHAAWLERKKQRKAKAQQKEQENFLSNLAEVDADIEFRYTFNVIGPVANQIVNSACEKNNQSRIAAGQASLGAKRSLIPIPYPAVAQDADKRQKLAKLVFNPMSFKDNLPVCKNRFEALQTAVIFAFHLDAVEEKGTFHDQLWAYEKAVCNFQGARRPLRPTRAIILCYTGSSEDEEKLQWRQAIEELEDLDGPVLHYGPISVDDGAGLHHIYATLASQRIQRLQRSDGADSCGSHESEAPPIWEAEGY